MSKKKETRGLTITLAMFLFVSVSRYLKKLVNAVASFVCMAAMAYMSAPSLHGESEAKEWQWPHLIVSRHTRMHGSIMDNGSKL